MSKNLISYASHTVKLFTKLSSVKNEGKIRIKMPDADTFAEEMAIFNSTNFLGKYQVIHNIEIGKFSNNIYALTNSEDLLTTEIIESLEEIGLKKVTPNGMYFMLMVKDMNLKIAAKKSIYEIDNKILHQHLDEKYSGHDWDDFAEFIESISIFQLESDSRLATLNPICMGYIIYSHLHTNRKPGSEELDETYREILESSLRLSKENIFLSLTSPHWKHTFLELYRCLEGIFLIPRAMELKSEINYSKSTLTLARKCVENLIWRRKEEDSLVQLISALELSIIKNSKLFNIGIFKDADSNDFKKIASKLYKIRNQLVHQIEDSSLLMTDSEWKDIVLFMLESCKFLYTKYHSELIDEDSP
jgi:hypothetical protein